MEFINFTSMLGSDYDDTFKLNHFVGRYFDGSDGIDTLDLSGIYDPDGIRVDMELGTVNSNALIAGPGAPAEIETISNFENVIGTFYDDIFYANENTPYDDLYSIENVQFEWGYIHKVRYGTGGDETLNQL